MSQLVDKVRYVEHLKIEKVGCQRTIEKAKFPRKTQDYSIEFEDEYM